MKNEATSDLVAVNRSWQNFSVLHSSGAFATGSVAGKLAPNNSSKNFLFGTRLVGVWLRGD